MNRRNAIKAAGTLAGLAWIGAPGAAFGGGQGSQIRVAAARFDTHVEAGTPTHGRTGATVKHVGGPLGTTVILLESDGDQVCLVASELRVEMLNINRFLRTEASKVLGLDPSRFLFFASHNHSVPAMAEVEVRDMQWYGRPLEDLPEVKLLPVGERFVDSLRRSLRELPDRMEPATVHWTQGHEGRISYNRKGRRADGTTYFMREEDRELVGTDFNGDIDRQVPVVVFRGQNDKPIAALMQFTAHPVTSYHPEDFTIAGDYTMAAAKVLGEALGDADSPVPVAFLQGCAGDTNSKEMFSGGITRAREFGTMLGESAVDALSNLRPSRLQGMDYVQETADIPLAPLPSEETLRAEIQEMKAFIRRANAGEEDSTLSVVGQNFPHALSPEYRGALVALILEWSEWALSMHTQGKQDEVMRELTVPVYILRLGDVAITGMPFEPFLGIGRQIRDASPFPLTIPCGYLNGSHGYITDSANTGDREYMSSFYRYTRYRPQFKKPAGDVVAERAVKTLNRFWKPA